MPEVVGEFLAAKSQNKPGKHSRDKGAEPANRVGPGISTIPTYL